MKKSFPIFGNGNGRPVFPGMAGNGNSRSPLLWLNVQGSFKNLKCTPKLLNFLFFVVVIFSAPSIDYLLISSVEADEDFSKKPWLASKPVFVSDLDICQASGTLVLLNYNTKKPVSLDHVKYKSFFLRLCRT